ncbi:hypothetical protein ABK040_013722 [Willaertia magna]
MSQPGGSSFLISQMKSICLIEKDTLGESLITWTFPSLTEQQKNVLLDRCPLINSSSSVLLKQYQQNGGNPLFIYSKYEDIYFYSLTLTTGNTIEKVTDIHLTILATEYYPAKYERYLQVLSKVLLDNQLSPVSLLEVFLRLFSKGVYKDQITADQFQDSREAKVGNLSLLFKLFGEESVKIWTAVLLKKRIVIYHESLKELLELVSTLPSLAWHRQQIDNIRPFVNFDKEIETNDLNNQGFYIAGTLERNMKSNSKYFDLFIDATTKRVTINENVLEDFKITKLHRDMLKIMLDESLIDSNAQLIKQCHIKTKEFLGKIDTIKQQNEGKLTLETIKSLQLNPDLERFLYNIAIVENMIN